MLKRYRLVIWILEMKNKIIIKYEGEFKDGTYSGYGSYTFPNGEKYERECKDGKMHGSSRFLYSDGFVQIGEWKDEEFVDGTED